MNPRTDHRADRDRTHAKLYLHHWLSQHREVVVVDPAWDVDSLVTHIASKDYHLTAALATHYHPDHVGGSFSGNKVEGYAKLLETNPVKLYAHNLEADALRR